MTLLSKAADLAQRTVTLTLFGTMIACGVGIYQQVREFKESSNETSRTSTITDSAGNFTREGVDGNSK
jgi:hypothetical protein